MIPEYKDLSEIGTVVNKPDMSLLDTAARAGAGGTIPGQVGLRPNGMKKANEVIDYFTPGKIGKKPRAFEEDIQLPDEKKDSPQANIAVILPRTFCADCNSRHCRPEGGAININIFPQDRMDLGVKANEVIVSFFCNECLLKHRAGITDPGKDISVADVHGVRSQRQKEGAERLVRCQKNLEDYIKWCRITNRMEIYQDEQRRR